MVMENKREYPAILSEGFQQIGIWELDKYFLIPFGNNEHRKKLIDRLQVYLNDFLALGIEAEVWIDGSFTTQKPEPEDIDMVFLLNRSDIDNLTGNKAVFFESLLLQRDEVRSRYHVDVYYIDRDDPSEVKKWQNNFGYDARKLGTKGIFKIHLK
jgi:hypothetical protein